MTNLAKTFANSKQALAQPVDSRIVQCHECQLDFKLPSMPHKHQALCPRCQASYTVFRRDANQKVIAFSVSALIFFVASLSFNFLSFSANGQYQSIDILGSLLVLVEQDYALLALVQGVCMLILPVMILLCLLYLLVPLSLGFNPTKGASMLTLIYLLLPWAMAEIFLVGVLVSVIKILSMAEIDIGLSFYAYVLFVLCMTSSFYFLDKYQLQQSLQVDLNPAPISPSTSIQTTWAYLCTALILYIPANVLPIMHTFTLGNSEPSTILGGVILLWQMGSYPIAMIIFFASVVVPVAKLVILIWLNFSVQQQHTQHINKRMFWYRATELIGRWSMIDVFVVAVLVSLIQLGNIISIVPGYAALAFCGVVISTMLAAMSFDPRLIWKSVPNTLAFGNKH